MLYGLIYGCEWVVVSEWKSFSRTFCDPMDYTVYGILQPRIVEWVAVPFSRGSSQPGDRTQVSCIAGGIFTSWATSDIWLNFSKCSISTWKNVHSVIAECTVPRIASSHSLISERFYILMHTQLTTTLSGCFLLRFPFCRWGPVTSRWVAEPGFKPGHLFESFFS